VLDDAGVLDAVGSIGTPGVVDGGTDSGFCCVGVVGAVAAVGWILNATVVC
jgi:hypothetical protein